MTGKVALNVVPKTNIASIIPSIAGLVFNFNTFFVYAPLLSVHNRFMVSGDMFYMII